MRDENLIDLHLYACGTSKVPKDYHFWSFISAVAAALADRVWVEKWADDKLYPNLYVMLLGPSALGKNTAIDRATRYVHKLPDVGHYRGKVTGAALLDHLAAGRKSHDGKKLAYGDPIVYLVTPELRESVGEGPVARDFISRMTGLYSPNDFKYNEGTRTHGAIELERHPTINWLSGTTIEWLVKAVSREDIEGGFFGRIIPVFKSYDLTKRGPARPLIPADHKEIAKKLAEELRHISEMEGRFRLSNSAREIQKHWWETRPLPADPSMLPTWQRSDDMIHKIAAVIAITEKVRDWRIRGEHFSKAIRVVEHAHRCVPDIIHHASAGRAVSDMEIVSKYIEIASRIGHSQLLKRCHKRGIHAPDVDKHVKALKDEGRISFDRSETGGRMYQWTRPKKVEVW